MTKLKIIKNKQIEPFYQIKIKYVASSYYEIYDETEYNISAAVADENPDQLIKFIKHLYVCHYSPPAEKKDGEANRSYDHVKTSCHYNKYPCGEDWCKYCSNKHRRNKFFEIKYSDCPEFLDGDETNDFYRYQLIKIYYYDENNSRHRVKIEFTDDDIQDIVKGIVDSHMVDYYNIKGYGNGPSDKFSETDPDIFMATHRKMIAKQTKKKQK